MKRFSMGLKAGPRHNIALPFVVLASLVLAVYVIKPELPGGIFPNACELSGTCLDENDDIRSKVDGKTADQRSSWLQGRLNGGSSSLSRQCDGRRVFLYELPKSMNDELVENCYATKIENFCNGVPNGGLGRRLKPWLAGGSSKAVRGKSSDVTEGWRKSWFMTDMYMQDVTMLHRFKDYPCLETNASKADVLYVPAHLGWLWWSVVSRGLEKTHRDKAGEALAALLSGQKSFRERGGHDHFLITGRPVWDLLRHGDVNWGTNLLYLPEFENITMITSETTKDTDRKQKIVSIANPTAFHPASKAELDGWFDHVRSQPRPYLYSLVAGRRSGKKTEGKLREILFDACDKDPRCISLDCKEKTMVEFAREEAATGLSRQNMSVCMDPRRVTDVMLQSRFCLQPVGDSATRRSTFDSLTAGCIPVYFSEASFEQQYEWFFPEDRRNLSVRFPLEDAEKGKINVGNELAKISKRRWEEMREAALKSVPGFLWYDHTASPKPDFKDSFDSVVEGMLSLSSRRRDESTAGVTHSQ